ncbi:MAG: YihY/virulence factor BrkB family protein, partial [Clostridia bacterium]|nr:YihY/virulence factor BrkB family protein [Clostridia bacterium]
FTAAVPFLSYAVLGEIMPWFVAQIISVTFLTMAAFFIAYLLNVFACPFKLSFEVALNGVLLTVTLWLISAVGCGIYLQFANPQKLYGAVAAVIVFLLWCYVMVNSLVVGMIYTSRFLPYVRSIKVI